MQRKLLTPPRLAAAAALALGGLIAGPSAAPAKAGDCTEVSVWIYYSQQGRDYVVGPRECTTVHTPWRNGRYERRDVGSNEPPTGTPSGAGIELWTI